MVGKVQDIVAAAIVTGATEKFKGDTVQSTQDASNNAQSLEDLSAENSVDQVNAGANAQNADNEDSKSKQDEQMDEESVSYMTEELNELMSRINCNLEFKYHKEVDMMSVKMLDKKTKEVLKEVPPEEMIQHMIKARDWLGAFIDKNV